MKHSTPAPLDIQSFLHLELPQRSPDPPRPPEPQAKVAYTCQVCGHPNVHNGEAERPCDRCGQVTVFDLRLWFRFLPV